MVNRLRIYILLVVAGANNLLHAQENVMMGKVVDSQDQPISFVLVINKANNKYTSTDSNGNFTLDVKTYPCKLELSILGYRTKVIAVLNNKHSMFFLEEESLMLPGVVVTAQLKSSDNGTSAYKIGNQAIKQVQAMSLGDILSVLPGHVISPPSMTNVQQFTTRTTENTEIDAFTSKIIIDGVSLSNDANLQAYNPAQGIFGGKSAVGGGFDLRAITPESIESIEVISGVPSVKYGNIASGVVLIKRKVTPQDFSLSSSLNATNYQLAVHHGLELPNGGVLSYSFSGTYATLSPTQQKDYYQSFSGTLLWNTTLSTKFNWVNTLSLQGGYGLNSKDFEDEDVFKNDEKFTTKNISMSVAGNLDLGVRLDYSFSTDIRKQNSYRDTKENNGPLPLLEGLETGTYKVPFSPFIYRLKEEIIGMPINFQGQLNFSDRKEWGKFHLINKGGIQFSFDKNFGEGRIGGKSIVGATGAIGSRAASFREIPALEI